MCRPSILVCVPNRAYRGAGCVVDFEVVKGKVRVGIFFVERVML
jgi:hypothetical protein